MYKSVYIFLLVMAVAVTGRTQSVDELISRAYIKYNDKDYRNAAAEIDEVVQLKKGEENEMAWHIRGFIYKDIYLHLEQASPDSDARHVAVFSLQKSMELDDEKVLLDNNRKALEYLAGSFWDDASEIIELRNPETIDSAETYFNQYMGIMQKLETEVNLDEMTMLYYLAMATAHRKIYEKERDDNSKHYEIANDYYLKVLDIDPESFRALYSVAVLNYNNAAYKLDKISDLDIHDVIKVQGESMRSIQFALPFMFRAYEVSPERIEAVKGLKYILFNLHDYEKSEHYEEELRRLEQEQKEK